VGDESKEKAAPVLNLPSPDIIKHLHARQQYLDFLEQIFEEVPAIKTLTYEDRKLFLPDSEYARLIAYEDEINGWLQKCSSYDSDSLAVCTGRIPFNAKWDLRKLIKKLAGQKSAHLEQEELKRRRLEALEQMKAPLEDVKKYLSPEEYRLFADNLINAADAYLNQGKGCFANDWRLDSRASVYIGFIGIIEERKKEEDRQKRTRMEYAQYIDTRSLAVEKFKAELAKSKKPQFVYPPELKNCEPDGWCDLDLPTQQQIGNWAEKKILERLPKILTPLTRWQLSWERWVLPRASYEYTGIPSLVWNFDTYILVTATLELKTGVIRKRRPEGYLVEVQAEGEKLGTLYLEPVEWLTPGSFTTPVALTRLLAEGSLEGPGITVIERSSPFTTFAVQGFEDEVEVCDSFRSLIRDIATQKPLLQALLDIGVIDADTAGLLKGKWNQPLPQPASGQSKTGDGTSTDEDVITALKGMGYKKAEIDGGLGTANIVSGMSTEEIIMAVLKVFGE